eukprot:CAMPEP_0184690300 /NCGR_PEP_ID=MMETSP0312-20130426/31145_1 /TAXON_ID=31354 /ORGANISM="Compsopogon coeruleus, Strain SAG 36.94" /LENGTH=600 /DNA_ID=CAMNT_0027147771 /DNA_START=174 /DNA_END=1976 /DNA_ORIENTATION=+
MPLMMGFQGEFVKGGKTIHWWDAPMRKLAVDVDTMNGVAVMVEIRDARIPRTSTHELFARWRAKFRCEYIVVYTHEDAIRNDQVQEIRTWTSQSLRIPEEHVFFEDLRGHRDRFGVELKPITSLIKTICENAVNPSSMGVVGTLAPRKRQAVKALVVGIPNVGKSSFVYIVTKEMTKKMKKKGMYHAPKVRDYAGQTQNIKSHWLFEKPSPIMLTDTPGVFPPAWQLEKDPESVYKIAVCGGVNLNDVTATPVGLSHREVADFLLYKLNEASCHQYVEYFRLADGPTDNVDIILQAVQQAQGNSEKARALSFIGAFNAGYLGQVVLDDIRELDHSHSLVAEKEMRQVREQQDMAGGLGGYDDNFLESPRDRAGRRGMDNHPLSMAWPGAETDRRLAREAGVRNLGRREDPRNSLNYGHFDSSLTSSSEDSSDSRPRRYNMVNGLQRNNEKDSPEEEDDEIFNEFPEGRGPRREPQGYRWESNDLGSFESNSRPRRGSFNDAPYQVSFGAYDRVSDRRRDDQKEPWEVASTRRSSSRDRIPPFIPRETQNVDRRPIRDQRRRRPSDEDFFRGPPIRDEDRSRSTSSAFDEDMEFHFDDNDF